MIKKVLLLSALMVSVSGKMEAQKKNCRLICNGNADDVSLTTSATLVNSPTLPCWKTTATDGKMEVWANGYGGVPSYSGIQFLELNATQAATMYQDFTASGGSLLSINFAHRGRAGMDSMLVSIGPVGGPYTPLMKVGDGNSAWRAYTAAYIVPASGNYSVRFTPIYWSGGNVAIGNFLDAVSVCAQAAQSICTYICNGDADDVFFTTSATLVSNPAFPCWKTTATDGKMEVWGNGYGGVPSYSGIQFIELNATQAATMYQDFNASAGTLMSISFAHRGRLGMDSMMVSMGPVGGPYVPLIKVGDGTTAWGYYTCTYVIPATGNYSVRFTPTYWSGGNVAIGNFLDAVQVCGTGIPALVSRSMGANADNITESDLQVKLFPQPSKDKVYFELNTTEESTVTLNVYNIQGQLVLSKSFEKGKSFELDKAQTGNGIFLYELQSEKGTNYGKLIFAD